MGRLVLWTFSLAALGACGGLAVPDPAPGDTEAAPPAEAVPVAARARDVTAGGGGAPTDAAPRGAALGDPGAAPVQGSGPMLECAGANCPAPGACGERFVDHDCDGAWKECSEGTHRDKLARNTCSSCEPDGSQVRSCEWARGRYLDFLGELTHDSCADFCDSAADCSASVIENACMSDLVLSLYGMINEEILLAAESFSNENCAALCGSSPPPSAEQPSGQIACVNHRCTFADYSSGSSP